MSSPLSPIEYVEARQVLLDAIVGLREHLASLVLVGAQAIYLRAEDRLPSYTPFTTDADLVLDPAHLAPTPSIGAAMEAAGFRLKQTGSRVEPGVWQRQIRRAGRREAVLVPVDLIVPAHVASPAGRRDARLGGSHGKASARKSAGLEGALVDHTPLELRALEPGDDRSATIEVAGVAALFVAKLHKLGDRLATPQRLEPKDAGDVYRLLTVLSPTRWPLICAGCSMTSGRPRQRGRA